MILFGHYLNYICYLRVAVDQRGEQTLNRDAKTTGGITHFASDNSSILKWTLNRAEQAKNNDTLLKPANLNLTRMAFTANAFKESV